MGPDLLYVFEVSFDPGAKVLPRIGNGLGELVLLHKLNVLLQPEVELQGGLHLLQF